MFGQKPWQSSSQRTWKREEDQGQAKTIHDAETGSFETIPVLRFLFAFCLGVFFFLVPVSWEGQITVPFDIAAGFITGAFPTLTSVAGLALITAGGALSLVAELQDRGTVALDDRTVERFDLDYWKTTPLFWLLRILGIFVAFLLFFDVGPDMLHTDLVGGLVWGKIVMSIVVIIPLGAVFVNLLVELGGLEFVGTLARPVMRPAFRLPGRAALDSLASWIGAFTVGYYVTYNVFHRGGYHKRDVFVIATCFAPVSIGFVGVVVSTVGLLQIFPLILVSWGIAVLLCGVILVRVPPLSNIPKEYIAEPSPEPSFTGTPTDYGRFAVGKALDEAENGRILSTAVTGLIDGLKVTAITLGTVVAISTVTLLVISQTDVFRVVSAPLGVVIAGLGIPQSNQVASAILISGIEQVSAAAVVAKTSAMARFFVTIVSISQIIFFAASAPMMMDMFNDIPVRFRDLIVIFALRTAILIPTAAILAHVANYLGLLP
ncbi:MULTISPECIES: nucleoside recognition domain-containing protein [unclassified Haladaptatus]|uniref:YjiH family protein n=1 Tax=unclassified Haladaptatus TaxID=2622732 RepID=UPI00209C6A40|nr:MULTISPECIES: nucleoside recognition domain-containing protein [unclassified Haladaptatus]MCO8243762.1 YjiH family protein [Haladaptatus sp. AB643]MCO8256703.1 YjiH family protein [Haladaptatus sp. AB618]